MADFNDEATPASSDMTPGRAAPYDGIPIQVRSYNTHGTFVDVPVDLRGTPQPILRVPWGLAVTSMPNGGINATPQRLFVVQTSPYYGIMLAAYEALQLVAPSAYGEMELGEHVPIQVIPRQIISAVPVILAAGQGQPQTLTLTPVGQFPMLVRVLPAMPVQHIGVSNAAALHVFPIPVSSDAEAVPQTPEMALMGMPAAQAMKKPSEWTVNEVAEFIMQISGCAGFDQVFRAHRIDGNALLLLCEHHLITVMNIPLGAALKIRSAIKWLRRKEKEGPVGPE
ncbi:hypothetical protein HPB49_022047 [Dermacentor silvarum]|uniref:Uncharacterized protein n=1 Tax=Dermacentor silvarum TaxID=543639 RepID=A0ACB8DRI6_DERSI|nr:uncharacterized protein LOC125940600 [Dermacentor silvarum]KAH7974955.1 hypothetical protein HPB49_022047 [Dermacentor silvarum]